MTAAAPAPVSLPDDECRRCGGPGDVDGFYTAHGLRATYRKCRDCGHEWQHAGWPDDMGVGE